MTFVYLESNFVEASSNSWWIDSGFNAHILRTHFMFLQYLVIYIGGGSFSLSKNNGLVSFGILVNGVYQMIVDNSFSKSLKSIVKLGHKSGERVNLLVKEEILLYMDFIDLSICVDCIKGKETKHTKKRATRSIELLEIIHSSIYGPFDR
ncbi:hypothetical protein V2J09_016237 [Rumex salicifolius]